MTKVSPLTPPAVVGVGGMAGVAITAGHKSGDRIYGLESDGVRLDRHTVEFSQ